jgi:hypothetical protein
MENQEQYPQQGGLQSTRQRQHPAGQQSPEGGSEDSISISGEINLRPGDQGDGNYDLDLAEQELPARSQDQQIEEKPGEIQEHDNNDLDQR